MSDTPDLTPVSYWILPAWSDGAGWHAAELSGPDFAGCGAMEYVRADLHEAERARAEKAEAERDALAGKLAWALHVLREMRDDQTGFRHVSHFRRRAANALAELTGGRNE